MICYDQFAIKIIRSFITAVPCNVNSLELLLILLILRVEAHRYLEVLLRIEPILLDHILRHLVHRQVHYLLRLLRLNQLVSLLNEFFHLFLYFAELLELFLKLLHINDRFLRRIGFFWGIQV